MSHTPGPWRLWLSEDDRGAFMLRGDSPERLGQDMVIVQRGIGTPNGDEGVANAHLIAAAPELLAALKTLRIDANRLCDRQLGGSYEDDCRRSLAVADAAIHKAKGAE